MKHFLQKKNALIAAWIAAALLLSIGITYALPIVLNGQSGAASCQLTMSFNRIAEGKDPKGNPIDINLITSDTVLKQALEQTGYQTRYTIDELRILVSVSAVAPNGAMTNLIRLKEGGAGKTTSVSNDVSPIGSYVVSIKDMGLISKKRSVELLGAIVAAYQDQIKTMYLQSVSATLGYSKEELLALDYPEMIDALTSEANSVVRYANSFAVASPNFVDAESGLSFADLSSQASAIAKSDMEIYSGLVSHNMLTKDRATRLQYEMQRLRRYNLQFAKFNTQGGSINTIVSTYDNTTNFIIPSADGLESQTENTFYSSLLDSLINARERASDAKFSYEQVQLNIEKLSENTETDISAMCDTVVQGVHTSYEKLSSIRTQIADIANKDYQQNVAEKCTVSNLTYAVVQKGSLGWNFLGMLAVLLLLYWGWKSWKKNHNTAK